MRPAELPEKNLVLPETGFKQTRGAGLIWSLRDSFQRLDTRRIIVGRPVDVGARRIPATLISQIERWLPDQWKLKNPSPSG